MKIENSSPQSSQEIENYTLVSPETLGNVFPVRGKSEVIEISFEDPPKAKSGPRKGNDKRGTKR